MQTKLEIFEKVLLERNDLFIQPIYDDFLWHLHNAGVISFKSEPEDKEEESVVEWECNYFCNKYTEDSIKKAMIKEARGNEQAWFERITKEEIIEREVDNFDSIEAATEWVEDALNERSIIEVKYGYVFQPL